MGSCETCRYWRGPIYVVADKHRRYCAVRRKLTNEQDCPFWQEKQSHDTGHQESSQ